MSEHSPLAGQVALVTGAAKRLGRHLALRLAKDGADIILHYRSSEDAVTVGVPVVSLVGQTAMLATGTTTPV